MYELSIRILVYECLECTILLFYFRYKATLEEANQQILEKITIVVRFYSSTNALQPLQLLLIASTSTCMLSQGHMREARIYNISQGRMR